MKKSEYSFSFDEYDSIDELKDEDSSLLKEARNATENAYAPYSHFNVGAVARMVNGKIVSGSNQENASFPVGLCAERVLLAAASSLYPNLPLDTIAISYHNNNNEGKNDHPIAPCGICRQALQEFEQRSGHMIRLILGGMEGKVFVLSTASSLLPMAFTKDELE